MSNVIEINERTFRQEVLDSPLPVLVDAYGRDCPPCRQIAPVIGKLAEEVDGKARVVKFEVGENRHLALALEIKVVPTFIIFQKGQEIARLRGLQSKKALLEALRVTEEKVSDETALPEV